MMNKITSYKIFQVIIAAVLASILFVLYTNTEASVFFCQEPDGIVTAVSTPTETTTPWFFERWCTKRTLVKVAIGTAIGVGVLGAAMYFGYLPIPGAVPMPPIPEFLGLGLAGTLPITDRVKLRTSLREALSSLEPTKELDPVELQQRISILKMTIFHQGERYESIQFGPSPSISGPGQIFSELLDLIIKRESASFERLWAEAAGRALANQPPSLELLHLLNTDVEKLRQILEILLTS